MLDQHHSVTAVFVPIEMPFTTMSDAETLALLPDMQNRASALYVRKPAGKSWRYHAVHPDTPGDKFRKRVTSAGRAKYEPAR